MLYVQNGCLFTAFWSHVLSSAGEWGSTMREERERAPPFIRHGSSNLPGHTPGVIKSNATVTLLRVKAA